MEKNKFKNIGKGVYISLAVCMLVIAGIGIFASVRSVSNLVNENVDNLDDVSVSKELLTGIIPQVVKDKDEDKRAEEEKTRPLPEKESVKEIVWKKPVEGEVVKRFSNGELFYSQTMNDYRTHNGIDVCASIGDSVTAVGGGIITDIVNDPLWGTTVSVDHGDGTVSVYKNLSDTLPVGIETGAYVEEGGIIGAVSTSALVEIGEAPHLHLEVYSNGVLADPIETLKIYE